MGNFFFHSLCHPQIHKSTKKEHKKRIDYNQNVCWKKLQECFAAPVVKDYDCQSVLLSACFSLACPLKK